MRTTYQMKDEAASLPWLDWGEVRSLLGSALPVSRHLDWKRLYGLEGAPSEEEAAYRRAYLQPHLEAAVRSEWSPPPHLPVRLFASWINRKNSSSLEVHHALMPSDMWRRKGGPLFMTLPWARWGANHLSIKRKLWPATLKSGWHTISQSQMQPTTVYAPLELGTGVLPSGPSFWFPIRTGWLSCWAWEYVQISRILSMTREGPELSDLILAELTSGREDALILGTLPREGFERRNRSGWWEEISRLVSQEGDFLETPRWEGETNHLKGLMRAAANPITRIGPGGFGWDFGGESQRPDRWRVLTLWGTLGLLTGGNPRVFHPEAARKWKEASHPPLDFRAPLTGPAFSDWLTKHED
jgi:hypothetical protein